MSKYNPEDFKVTEENEDFKLSTIERSNMKNEFTLTDLENSQADLEKMKTELLAQQSLCVATCDNIARNHPAVEEMEEDLKHHVWMYYENKKVVDDATAKLTEVEEQLENYEVMTEVIYEAAGFVKLIPE